MHDLTMRPNIPYSASSVFMLGCLWPVNDAPHSTSSFVMMHNKQLGMCVW